MSALLDTITTEDELRTLYRAPSESWAELARAPDIWDVIIEQVGMNGSAAAVRSALEAGYASDLEDERSNRGVETGG